MTIVIDTPLRQTMPGVGWMHGLADIAESQCGHGAFAVLLVISSNQIEAQHHLAKRKRKSEENKHVRIKIRPLRRDGTVATSRRRPRRPKS